MRKIFLSWVCVLLLTSLLYAQNNVNVYVFIAEECPISIYMAQPLKQVAKKYSEQANFYAVFPKKNSNTATASKFLEEYQLNNFSTMLDNEQTLSRRLNALVTPEVIITDAKGDVLYKGRITNAYAAPGKMKHGSPINNLDKALTMIIKGQEVPQPWHKAVGCFITYHKKS